MDLDETATSFHEFVDVIKALRTPATGCPWDLEQDHRSLRPYLIEEAYEVVETIDDGDDSALCEELGDLLLQVVLHAQVAADRGAFCITDVIRGITAKMVRRHPHVFRGVKVAGSAEVVRNWEQIKMEEKGGQRAGAAALEQLPSGLPALARVQRVCEKGADKPELDQVVDRVKTQIVLLEEAARAPDEPRRAVETNLGEVLFSLCQLARRLGVNAEDSLREHTRRFADRSV